MKKSILSSAAFLLAANLLAAPINFNFTDIEINGGSDTNFSTNGDTWRATNIFKNPGDPDVYAIFNIIEVSPGSTPNAISFVSGEQPARGDRLRMRFNTVGQDVNFPIWAKVQVNFYNAVDDSLFQFLTGDEILTQFDDLDSDDGQDYSDFAGLRQSDFDSSFLNNPTNLVKDTDLIPDFEIGILETPWGPQENEESPLPGPQAPYTIGFEKEFMTDGAFTFQFVMGVDSSSFSPNRHIDMDMSGVLIPEPGTIALMAIALGGAGGLALLKRRKRA